MAKSKQSRDMGNGADEFYNLKEFDRIVTLISPSPEIRIYEMACGTGGLLIEAGKALVAAEAKQGNTPYAVANPPFRLEG